MPRSPPQRNASGPITTGWIRDAETGLNSADRLGKSCSNKGANAHQMCADPNSPRLNPTVASIEVSQYCHLRAMRMASCRVKTVVPRVLTEPQTFVLGLFSLVRAKKSLTPPNDMFSICSLVVQP